MSHRRLRRSMERWTRYADRCERLALANGWGTSAASKCGHGRGWGQGGAYIRLHQKIYSAQRHAGHVSDLLEHRRLHRTLRWLRSPDWYDLMCGRCKRRASELP